MNHIIETTLPGTVPAVELADWALARGITSLSTQDVMRLCALPANQVSQRMASLRKKAKLFSPARSLWVPIPPEYRTWGAPDPMYYIDDLMTHLDADYLVGWLTAAERHGAGHHAAQVFQVAASKTVRGRTFGRSRLEFYNREYVDKVTHSTELLRKTGVRVAAPGTTMLMLAADINLCGGVSNVANLIIELMEENPGFEEALVADAPFFPDATPRRIGWLLDEYGDGAPEGLLNYCASLSSEPSYLAPTVARKGNLDSKWKIVLNEEVDLDI